MCRIISGKSLARGERFSQVALCCSRKMAKSAIQCVKLQLVIFILIVVTIILSIRVGVYENRNSEIPIMKVLPASDDSGKYEIRHDGSINSKRLQSDWKKGESQTFTTNSRFYAVDQII